MTGFSGFDAALADGCRRFLEAGFSLVIQSTLLLALGLFAGRLLRGRGPAVRSLVYRTTLAAVALGTVLFVLLYGRLEPLWDVALPAAVPPGHHPAAPAGRPLVETGPAHAAPGAAGWRIPVPLIGGLYVGPAALWLAGALLGLGWLGVCYLHIGRLRRHSRPVRDPSLVGPLDDLSRRLGVEPPQLRASAHIRAPFITGLRAPLILLPASYADDWSGDALRAILAHELTHLARRDCGWNLLGRVACAVFWPQPLVWALCRRMEQASEEACDESVLEQECSRRAYADCLLRLAEHMLAPRWERAAGASVVPFRSSVGRRIEQILSPPRGARRSLSSASRSAIAAAAAGLVVSLQWCVSVGTAPAAPAPLHIVASVPEAPEWRSVGTPRSRQSAPERSAASRKTAAPGRQVHAGGSRRRAARRLAVRARRASRWSRPAPVRLPVLPTPAVARRERPSAAPGAAPAVAAFRPHEGTWVTIYQRAMQERMQVAAAAASEDRVAAAATLPIDAADAAGVDADRERTSPRPSENEGARSPRLSDEDAVWKVEGTDDRIVFVKPEPFAGAADGRRRLWIKEGEHTLRLFGSTGSGGPVATEEVTVLRLFTLGGESPDRSKQRSLYGLKSFSIVNGPALNRTQEQEP